MTDAEKREAARQIYNKWKDKGKEDEDDRSFWLDILTRLFGVIDATDKMDFQKKVIGPDGNTKKIDVYIPDAKVLIEQKSRGIVLDKPQAGHNGMTPYEQAKLYDNSLPHSEKSRWIILSNFAEIWIYDMEARKPEPVKFTLDELPNKYSLLEFMISDEVKKVTREMELSLEAGKLVGKIHDRFQEQYNDPMAKRTQNSLNILCVRLVFCLYAEDAGLFGPTKDAFTAYLNQYDPKDMRRALLDLFKVLDTPVEQRAELYLDDELEAFPYVNGGLFARENIEIPKLTQELKDTLIESAAFDWSEISPTIFGAVFESTLNPETRRSGGMHYTSIENIHKVIDPLFLDDLQEELANIKALKVDRTRERQLKAFQDKLASLKWFDPACGSGNFLTETYMSIRRLENEVLAELNHGQISFGFETANPIKVGIDQFYGIEINDFAVTVAKTALWIAESQMMKETEDVVHADLDFLPLKTNASIIEGNALRIDWNKIIHKDELSYIMGNPPFVGYSLQNKEQKEDIKFVAPYMSMNVDYVAMWYIKASEMMKDTSIKTAFVSTNSICQGEQVPAVWKILFEKYGIHIDFAYKTFQWDSEANIKAHVHCVIVGFSTFDGNDKKILYDGDTKTVCDCISPYLIKGTVIFIEKFKKAISGTPAMLKGSSPVDGGYFFVSDEEKNNADSITAKYIHRFYGAKEYLHNKDRWVLWLEGILPSEINKSPFIKERIEKVRKFRLASTKAATRKYADYPTRFMECRQPKGSYILIPRHTSQNRRYIPFGFIDASVICGDANGMIPDATMYHFGVLISNVHMAWMRVVCGRIKSDYRYTNDVVYNTFPWPAPTDAQKAKIEQTAQGILDARALYPESSLADLYDPLTMPPELRKAHQLNDKAVMQAYGFDIKNTSEADCVARLMKMYQELTC